MYEQFDVCISHIISDVCSGNYMYVSAQIRDVCVQTAINRLINISLLFRAVAQSRSRSQQFTPIQAE
jgi:hypothetical protein